VTFQIVSALCLVVHSHPPPPPRLNPYPDPHLYHIWRRLAVPGTATFTIWELFLRPSPGTVDSNYFICWRGARVKISKLWSLGPRTYQISVLGQSGHLDGSSWSKPAFQQSDQMSTGFLSYSKYEDYVAVWDDAQRNGIHVCIKNEIMPTVSSRLRHASKCIWCQWSRYHRLVADSPNPKEEPT
jgi:hypothetical protein